MTKRELVEALSKFPDDAHVGVRAACCGHAHDIQGVREPSEADWSRECDVIIDAEE